MEVDAVVNYANGKARFKIYMENTGIYYADLVSFEGDEELTPPSCITLIRGVRQWTGSYNDDILLNELGKFIDEHQLTD